MKKITILSIFLLILAVATSTFAGGVTPSWKALAGTTWVGVLTFVHTDNSTSEDNATLTFSSTATGKFLSGTIACSPNSDCADLLDLNSQPLTLLFSGIKNGDELLLTADGYSMFALISIGRPAKRGKLPAQYMTVEGSHFDGGDTFLGTLSKQ
jgi:hypothetical protein